MSQTKDFKILRKIIDNNNSAIDTDKILESSKGSFKIRDLLNYWKQGLLYINKVQRSETGYLPMSDCLWSVDPQIGYFAFNSALGVYQISENITNPIIATLEGTIGLDAPISSIAIHPNRQQFALGSRHGMIYICSLEQCRITKTISGSDSRTWVLAYSPSGNFLLSGHQNGDLVKWENDKFITTVRTDDWVRSITFSSKEDQFITSHRVKNNNNPSIYQWDMNSFWRLDSFMHIPETTWCVRYLMDDTGFVSAGSDKKVTVWSFVSNHVLWSEKKHLSTVIVLALHPIGGVVASGSWTGSLKIWDLDKGTDIVTIEAHSNRVYGLAFSPSGTVLASGSKDSQICLWEMPAGNILARFTGHLGWVRALEFIDENTLITIGTDGFCKIWRLSYSLPKSKTRAIYHSAKEVLNDYHRFMVPDDE